jgi:prevent-host-death family protein
MSVNPDTDRWVRSDEARAKFRDLVDEVAQEDSHVYLLRYDKPVAVLVPVEWYEEVKAKISEKEEKA